MGGVELVKPEPVFSLQKTRSGRALKMQPFPKRDNPGDKPTQKKE